jgi:hypothetical protein
MKAITTKDIKIPERRPKTKAWDPSQMISTGNIEQVIKANKAAEKKGKK